MASRRVLLRIKKLRKFLDGRIREWRQARDGAEDDESRQRASARVEAYQDVREQMLDGRLPVDREGEGGGGQRAGQEVDGEEAGRASG